MKAGLIVATLLFSQASLAVTPAVTEIMSDLKTQGAQNPSAARGEAFWNQVHAGQAPFTQRSCNSCHTRNLASAGEHVRTGKSIKPLAPSVNEESLTEVSKINKWFKRNCKWTLGRECSAQEKADILAFISQQ